MTIEAGEQDISYVKKLLIGFLYESPANITFNGSSDFQVGVGRISPSSFKLLGIQPDMTDPQETNVVIPCFIVISDPLGTPLAAKSLSQRIIEETKGNGIIKWKERLERGIEVLINSGRLQEVV